MVIGPVSVEHNFLCYFYMVETLVVLLNCSYNFVGSIFIIHLLILVTTLLKFFIF